MKDSQSDLPRARKRPPPVRFTLTPEEWDRLFRLSRQRGMSEGLLAKAITLGAIQNLDSDAGVARTSDELERNASIARTLAVMSITLDHLIAQPCDAAGGDYEVKLLQALQAQLSQLSQLMRSLMT